MTSNPISIQRLRDAGRAVTLIIIALGVLGVLVTVRSTNRELRTTFLTRAKTAAAAIDVEQIMSLRGSEEDLGTPAYNDLKYRMTRLAIANTDARFVYLMGRRDGRIFFFVDSESPNSPDYSPPGDPYYEYTSTEVIVFNEGIPLIEGPASDRWGTWMTALAPIRNPQTHKVEAVLGMDIPATAWFRQIIMAALLPASAALLLIILIITYYVTTRKTILYAQKTEDQKRYFESMLSVLPIGIAVVEAPGGTINMMNTYGRELLGIRSDTLSIVSRDISFFHTGSGKRYRLRDLPASITLRTGSMSIKDDVSVIHPTRGPRALRIISAPLPSLEHKDQGNVIVVFEDITEERATNQAKTEFVSIVSHQLRTPLSSMHWYIEAILSGDIGKVTTQQKSYLESIAASTQSMIDLVNTLLDVSRLEFGTFAIEPTPLRFSDIVQSLVQEIQPLADQKHITLTTHYDQKVPTIPLDQRLCSMIIQNILSNAVKYTPNNGQVHCAVMMHEGIIRFTVTDTGYGIPKSSQEHVFDKVYRAPNVIKKEIQGTGLGLYIVKTIVEKVGGKIWFESEEGKGTQFFVEIPSVGMLRSTPLSDQK